MSSNPVVLSLNYKRPNQTIKGTRTYPDNDSSGLIASADLEICALADVVIQKLEEVIRFFLLETDNGPGEALVDVERLLAGHRVDTNNGVLALDRFPANWPITNSREFGLGDGRVQCPETLEALFELGGEAIVGLNLGQEKGVATADLGLVENEEEGGARGLQFVGDVGMPQRVTGPVGTSIFAETVVLGIAINNVELGEALDIPRRRVPLDGAEVPLKDSK